MSVKPGCIQRILFRAVGPNPAIPSLRGKVAGKLDGKPIQVGDLRFGEPSKLAFISLEIVGWMEDKTKAMSKLKAWLIKHGHILRRTKAEKWIEVCTYLLPNQAYEQMGFTIEVMKAAILADCHLDNTCYALITPRDSMHLKLLKTWEEVRRPTGKSTVRLRRP
jgi:hypothetical protein